MSNHRREIHFALQFHPTCSRIQPDGRMDLPDVQTLRFVKDEQSEISDDKLLRRRRDSPPVLLKIRAERSIDKDGYWHRSDPHQGGRRRRSLRKQSSEGTPWRWILQ